MQCITPPTLKYIEGFNIMGFSTRTQNRDESDGNTAKIPALWQRFYSSELMPAGAPIFGVYSNYDTDEQGFYIVTAGVKTQRRQPQYTSSEVQTGNYLVFQGKGPMPSAVIEAWTQVWQYFKETDEYQRNFTSDFEEYTGPNEVAIYIGIY